MTAIKGTTPQKRARTLGAAKTEFTLAVTRDIEELMHRLGYSRERATQTLLEELGRGIDTPSDDEIFHMMELQGLGMEDALKALVVSKAVRRVMKVEGFSAIEAIDELTSKLSVTNLFVSASPAAASVTPREIVRQRSPARRTTSSTAIAQQAQQSQRKLSARKPVLKKQPKTSIVTTKNPRKRSIGEDPKDTAKSGRARADSVSEQVNAKIADTRSGSKRKDVVGNSAGSTAPVKRPKL